MGQVHLLYRDVNGSLKLGGKRGVSDGLKGVGGRILRAKLSSRERERKKKIEGGRERDRADRERDR